MNKRHFLRATALASLAIAGSTVFAQDNVFKIGLILPMTGQQATTGRQIEAAAKLYMAQNGATVAGKKIVNEERGDEQRAQQGLFSLTFQAVAGVGTAS